jgi:hypothetical protein
MVFAALHPEASRIDATLDDLGCGLSWAAVHKVRPRAALPGLRPRGNSLRPWRDHSVALHGIIPWYYDGSQAGPVAG